MVDRLDVIAVGIGVVAGMRAESFHHCAVLLLQCEVLAPGQLPLGDLAVRGENEKFIGPEPAIAVTAMRHAEHLQDRIIELTAGVNVEHHRTQVVDKPPRSRCSISMLSGAAASETASKVLALAS